MIYRAQGKEVLRGREHFADVCDEQAAFEVAQAMNKQVGYDNPTITATSRGCAITKQTDEYYCSTHNTRWDADEEAPECCVTP